MFYFIKGDRTSAWGSKDLNFGGNNLTNINFANIGGEVKFIDTLKYYQKSPEELASTLTEEEKESVKKLTGQYLNKHYYLCEVWKYLSEAQKERILDIISEGKSNIPCENIVNMHSLFSTPKNGIFFEKPEFSSELKQKAVNDSDYQTSFYSDKTFRMRHLGDMNDLYSVQDVILLCEIYENRFQFMNDRYGFNPRKCNSASTLSGCVEREMSRVIITLPTSNEIVDIFEQSITGGFSCVNNHLAFDTEIFFTECHKTKRMKKIMKLIKKIIITKFATISG